MGVRGWRRRASLSPAGADLVSDLGDDVLVRVLSLLPDASDAVRTGALSRRWRGLWTRSPSLRFASDIRRLRPNKFKGSRGAKRFIAFVDDTLARRSRTTSTTADAAAALEHLAISFVMGPVGDKAVNVAVPRSIKAAQDWFWYAMQGQVKSFVLDLSLPLGEYRDHIACADNENLQEQPMIDLTELPDCPKLETMHWALDGATLCLPMTAVFTSLEDLSLEDIEFPAGSGHLLLRRLLSSACCPRLQKLKLRKLGLPELNELLVEASALLELSYEDMSGPRVLELKTPNLRVLRIGKHSEIQTLRISAPRLEKLTLLDGQPEHVDIDGELPCVRSLGVELYSHKRGDDDDDDDANKVSTCLLQCCTSVTCLEVSLDVVEAGNRAADIISGRIPHLPHLIALTVHVCLPELHSFGVGLADILTQCSNLKYLRIHVVCTNSLRRNYSCHHSNHWRSHEMHLHDIREVEFTGMVGTNCERWFMERVLRHATELRKGTLSFDPKFRLKRKRDGSEFIPRGSGTWARHHRGNALSYEWKPDVQRESEQYQGSTLLGVYM